MTTPHPRAFPAGMADAARAFAGPRGIAGAIDPRDYIFWYIFDAKGEADGRLAAEEYLDSGGHAAALLRSILDEARVRELTLRHPNGTQRLSVLEFAAGYGRVTRHFPAILPGAEIVACDIHGPAIEFLRGLGFDAMQSSHRPEAFDLRRRFDVIFAYSFFTHMPRTTWTMWLEAMARHLSDDGILVFTAHGEVSQELMRVAQLEEDGFFFHPASEQSDLPEAEYGNTVTAFDFVHSQIKTTGLELVQFRQAGAGHHDAYVLTRPSRPARHYVSRFEAEREQSAGRARQLERELDALHASTCWRLTAPLRSVSRAVRGRPAIAPAVQRTK